MAPTDKIKKFAKAKSLGIDGYRTMTDAQLDAAIAKAEGGSKSTPAKGKVAPAAKGKVSTPAAKGKTAATPARSTAAKGKTTTAPAAKSTTRKSSPTATAAKGKATRQSPAKGKTTTTTKQRHAAKDGSRVMPKAAPKTTATAQRVGATIVKEQGERNFLDKKGIDWKAESTVGRTGKRQEVLAALRKYRGDYAKCFEALKANAKSYYKGKTKAEAEHLLKWLIARVAYDFVMNTGQHQPGSRRAYGTAGTNGSATKTTATKRVAAAKKTTTATKAPARRAPATKGKPATTTRKPAQRRTAAPKGKVAAGKR